MSAKQKQEILKAAQQEVLRLSTENGGVITVDEVIEHASKPENPMHPFFTWNKEAGWRKNLEDEARGLIRSVKLDVERITKNYSVSALTRDPRVDSTEQGYVQMAVVKTQPEIKLEVMLRELRRVDAQLRKSIGMAEYFGWMAEFDAALEAITGLIRKAEAAA